MLNKLVVTARLVEHFPDGISVDQAMTTWWQNIRPNGGLRLTDRGYQAFDFLELEKYRFELPEQFLTAKNLLALDQYMQWPYHIANRGRQRHLTMFGSREAMMATLLGDLEQFVISLTY